jgi:rhodanese-related sulfurtransferase
MQYLNDFTGIRATIQGPWRVTGGQFSLKQVDSCPISALITMYSIVIDKEGPKMPVLKPVRLLTFILILSTSVTLALWPQTGVDAAKNIPANIISASEAQAAAAAGDVTIVDVRSPREWRQTGVAEGARTVTIHNRKGIKALVATMVKTVGGDKSKSVALICAAAVRSARALKILAAAGFTQIQNVSEGMLGRPDAGLGWLKRGLPVTHPVLLR